MAEPKFGPAGNSESFAAAGFKKSEDAPAWLAQMGLTAFEYQCGRGVRCGEETALKIGAAAKQHGIQMSIHAPYFINLSSEESERMEKNVGYVLETARLAVPLGATRMVVHCGGQGKLTRDRAMRNSHENVKNILRALDARSAWKPWAKRACSALPRRFASWWLPMTACCRASTSVISTAARAGT